MARKNIKDAVIKFLEGKNFEYIKSLGEGGFASVIAVMSSEKEVIAVKIIAEKDVGLIEDKIWPLLSHRNILPVLNVLKMENPAVKLYLTPMLPKALDETIYNDKFRFDQNGLLKLKLWMNDILLALDYLHSSGFCHCDLKTDNVLIDKEEIAVLCDFSGLNYTRKPLSDIVSPYIFRPPECFCSVVCENIQGVPFDIYTFGLMALNMLTGHWPQKEWMKNTDENVDWSSDIWPVLKKALWKENFEYLMRNSLPGSKISERDISQALDFILSILKMNPDERPSAKDIMKHPFLKMGGNPFKSEKDKDLSSQGDGISTNPFEEFDYIHVSGNNELNVQQVNIGEICIVEEKLKYDIKQEIAKNIYLLPKQESVVDQIMSGVILQETAGPYLSLVQQFDNTGITDKFSCLLGNVTLEEMRKEKKRYVKKNIKEKVTNWFRKKFKR